MDGEYGIWTLMIKQQQPLVADNVSPGICLQSIVAFTKESSFFSNSESNTPHCTCCVKNASQFTKRNNARKEDMFRKENVDLCPLKKAQTCSFIT